MTDETRPSVPVVLTVAGSDSGGGAGIQADLKTFEALGVFGTTAITCVTAQNPDEVAGVAALDPGIVALQIKTVCRGFPVSAVKTGMLFSGEIIHAVARSIVEYGFDNLVVDPVMVATSGARLLEESAQDALCSEMLPIATVITPNLPEAELLCEHRIQSVGELELAAGEIGEKFAVACVVKGGHLHAASGTIVDVLYADGQTHIFSGEAVVAEETHGTGCTFSAALTAYLARGLRLVDAVAAAKQFVSNALASAPRAGEHTPLSWKSPRL